MAGIQQQQRERRLDPLLSPSSPSSPPFLLPPPPPPPSSFDAPVVVVRLPGKRPRVRPWSQLDEARLTRVCQECWPHVDWPAVAQELGRDVRDCISQSTLLHLQELERSEAPPSPSPSSPTELLLQQQQQQREREQQQFSHPLVGGGGKGGDNEEERSVLGSLHRKMSSGSGSSSLLGAHILPTEVAALALQHKFDWEAVGAALKADPWDCWKTYELHCQDKMLSDGGADVGVPASSSSSAASSSSPFLSGAVAAPAPHVPTTVSALADDVAAFLPFTSSSPSPLHHHPLAHPFPPSHHPAMVDEGVHHTTTTAATTTMSPPPPQGSSFLHQFPRQSQRSRLAASFVRSSSASSLHQLGGGGEPPMGGGMQDSTYSQFSVGAGASTFLPGSESLSLSMLQAAILDMPSLYLGHSTAFGAGASTFLAGGGGAGSVVISPNGNSNTVSGGGGNGVGVGGGPSPFVPSSSPLLPPPMPPRGVGFTPDIPDTILEGAGIDSSVNDNSSLNNLDKPASSSSSSSS